MVSLLAVLWLAFDVATDYFKSHNFIVINILNNLSLITVVLFMAMTFYVFKKMITYQKTRNTFTLWKLFELAIFLSLPLAFVHFDYDDQIFRYILIVFFIFGLILSVNQNWIVYFNLRQKWNSILLTTLILAISLLFILFIYYKSSKYGSMASLNDQVIDIIHDVPIVSLFVFIITYSVFSVLVMLFNLPISNAFEKKFKETANFQQLSQIIRMGDKEEKIYPVLLETSINIVMADAAWLDIYEEKDIARNLTTHNIEPTDIRYLRVLVDRKLNVTLTSVLNLFKIQDTRVKSFLSSKPYKSLLFIPLSYGYEIIGELVLLRDLKDGFDKQLINSVKAYADQAVSSIINSRLLREAIENQRYQEEKKIAKEVKNQLVNEEFSDALEFDIAASLRSYSDVGGDYFDFDKISESQYVLVMADVSGSGITAAFNMAQLKGIFKTLILSKNTPREFILEANKALSSSLSKTSFVTLSLFFIDTSIQEIKYVRAGHCPAIFYESKNKEITYLNEKGLGLGILRTNEYESYISEGKLTYQKGDVLTLFTDGLIETRNDAKEEFGYENLSGTIKTNIDLESKLIIEEIFSEILSFQDHDKFTDDLSCMIV